MNQAMDDDIRIQIIIGRAGTGKTHIAMAAALEKVFKERKYDSIKLIKPIVTKSRLGEDIGFLPGSVKRKLINCASSPLMPILKKAIKNCWIQVSSNF